MEENVAKISVPSIPVLSQAIDIHESRLNRFTK